jgi:uncharacterized OB-fold protein
VTGGDHTSVMLREGLVSEGEKPALLGGRCDDCSRHHFPFSDVCPYCSGDRTVVVELSRSGSLWAWTAVTSAPPGYSGTVPYGFGVVELPEGIRVLARITEADPSRLRAGQQMRLVVVPVRRDEQGRELTTYAFAPSGRT